jgi:hypothetical protein
MSAHLLILTVLATGPGASDPTTAIVAAERAVRAAVRHGGNPRFVPGVLRARRRQLRARSGPRSPAARGEAGAKDPEPILEWGPEQAEAAPGGELGWTAGPSKITDRTGKRPPRHGYYFSLWRKQRDGTFKVVLDMGTDTPRGGDPRHR